MERQTLCKEIEMLRSELTEEYSKLLDGHEVAIKVMMLSEKLDKLILAFMKGSNAEPDK